MPWDALQIRKCSSLVLETGLCTLYEMGKLGAWLRQLDARTGNRSASTLGPIYASTQPTHRAPWSISQTQPGCTAFTPIWTARSGPPLSSPSSPKRASLVLGAQRRALPLAFPTPATRPPAAERLPLHSICCHPLCNSLG